eukprot:Nitzschia sp. Nitz4//scaffold311_size21207//16238//20680//NITZ4_008625-RA/size21207-processed-gene-0.50-mRNA-1//1//CDS//3329547395//7561//frame0
MAQLIQQAKDKVAELRALESTYTQDPPDSKDWTTHLSAWDSQWEAFSTASIPKILEAHADVAKFHSTLVGTNTVPNKTFWMRYKFQCDEKRWAKEFRKQSMLAPKDPAAAPAKRLTTRVQQWNVATTSEPNPDEPPVKARNEPQQPAPVGAGLKERLQQWGKATSAAPVPAPAAPPKATASKPSVPPPASDPVPAIASTPSVESDSSGKSKGLADRLSKWNSATKGTSAPAKNVPAAPAKTTTKTPAVKPPVKEPAPTSQTAVAVESDTSGPGSKSKGLADRLSQWNSATKTSSVHSKDEARSVPSDLPSSAKGIVQRLAQRAPETATTSGRSPLPPKHSPVVSTVPSGIVQKLAKKELSSRSLVSTGSAPSVDLPESDTSKKPVDLPDSARGLVQRLAKKEPSFRSLNSASISHFPTHSLPSSQFAANSASFSHFADSSLPPSAPPKKSIDLPESAKGLVHRLAKKELSSRSLASSVHQDDTSITSSPTPSKNPIVVPESSKGIVQRLTNPEVQAAPQTKLPSGPVNVGTSVKDRMKAWGQQAHKKVQERNSIKLEDPISEEQETVEDAPVPAKLPTKSTQPKSLKIETQPESTKAATNRRWTSSPLELASHQPPKDDSRRKSHFPLLKNTGADFGVLEATKRHAEPTIKTPTLVRAQEEALPPVEIPVRSVQRREHLVNMYSALDSVRGKPARFSFKPTPEKKKPKEKKENKSATESVPVVESQVATPAKEVLANEVAKEVPVPRDSAESIAKVVVQTSEAPEVLAGEEVIPTSGTGSAAEEVAEIIAETAAEEPNIAQPTDDTLGDAVDTVAKPAAEVGETPAEGTSEVDIITEKEKAIKPSDGAVESPAIVDTVTTPAEEVNETPPQAAFEVEATATTPVEEATETPTEATLAAEAVVEETEESKSCDDSDAPTTTDSVDKPVVETTTTEQEKAAEATTIKDTAIVPVEEATVTAEQTATKVTAPTEETHVVEPSDDTMEVEAGDAVVVVKTPVVSETVVEAATEVESQKEEAPHTEPSAEAVEVETGDVVVAEEPTTANTSEQIATEFTGPTEETHVAEPSDDTMEVETDAVVMGEESPVATETATEVHAPTEEVQVVEPSANVVEVETGDAVAAEESPVVSETTVEAGTEEAQDTEPSDDVVEVHTIDAAAAKESPAVTAQETATEVEPPTEEVQVAEPSDDAVEMEAGDAVVVEESPVVCETAEETATEVETPVEEVQVAEPSGDAVEVEAGGAVGVEESPVVSEATEEAATEVEPPADEAMDTQPSDIATPKAEIDKDVLSEDPTTKIATSNTENPVENSDSPMNEAVEPAGAQPDATTEAIVNGGLNAGTAEDADMPATEEPVVPSDSTITETPLETERAAEEDSKDVSPAQQEAASKEVVATENDEEDIDSITQMPSADVSFDTLDESIDVDDSNNDDQVSNPSIENSTNEDDLTVASKSKKRRLRRKKLKKLLKTSATAPDGATSPPNV